MKKNNMKFGLIAMSGILFLATAVHAQVASSTESPVPTLYSATPTLGLVACTMDYTPVCGEKQVQCIKAPCPPLKVTFGNRCQLDAEKGRFLYAGECKKDEPIKPTSVISDKGLIKQLEARIVKLEKENQRLYKLVKVRELEIKKLKKIIK